MKLFQQRPMKASEGQRRSTRSPVNPFSGQPVLRSTRSQVNPFWSKPVLVQTRSGPNPFWSKPVLVQTLSRPNPFWSKPFLVQTHSHPNPFSSKPIAIRDHLGTVHIVLVIFCSCVLTVIYRSRKKKELVHVRFKSPFFSHQVVLKT